MFCHVSQLTDEQQFALYRLPRMEQARLTGLLEYETTALNLRSTRANATRIQQIFEAMLKRLNVPSEPVALGA